MGGILKVANQFFLKIAKHRIKSVIIRSWKNLQRRQFIICVEFLWASFCPSLLKNDNVCETWSSSILWPSYIFLLFPFLFRRIFLSFYCFSSLLLSLSSPLLSYSYFSFSFFFQIQLHIIGALSPLIFFFYLFFILILFF